MIFTNHLPSRRLPAIGAGYRFCRFSTVVTVRRYFNFQKSLKWITGVFGLLFISEYLDDTRAGVYQLVPWLARLFDPEKCHEYAMLAAQLNILPKEHMKFPVSLQTNVFGLSFSSPLGLAAGFDKNGAAINSLSKLGFSFIEIGSITPLPQEGNPKPRVFRLSEDDAIINRYGFNSEGMDSVYGRLSRQVYFNILGINLGKNKNTEGQENILSDYTKTMEKLYRFADYFVINVSSPNTEGLRSLQESSALENLLSGILLKRDQLHSLESYITGTRKKTPVLVKISPDLEYTDVQNMITSLKKVNIDGVIISNTTVSRAASLQNIHAVEIGGLSGKPLAEKSLHLTKTFYEGFEGKIPIINVGGVFTGEDVYKRLCHGASLVQIYSVLALNGPGTVTHIKGELAKILESKKIKHVSDIIGSDTKFPKKS